MLSLLPNGVITVGLGIAAVASSKAGIHTAIIVGVIVGFVNTIFLVYLNSRTAKNVHNANLLAEKDKELDRLSRRCDRLVDVLDRSGVTIREADREDVRDGK